MKSIHMNVPPNLRYGSLVRIIGKTQNGQKGIITSKGFFDHEAYFQTYEDLGEINNFREGLFQILPSGSFEIHDEFLKGRGKNLGLLQRMKSEKEQYFHMIDNKMNEVIHFSSEVIFQHYESGQYLTCSSECSESRSDSFGLVLQQHLSSRQIFKIEPSKVHQQIGRPIISKQPVKIQSEITKYWIDRNVQNPVPLDHKASQTNIKIDLRKLQYYSHRFELIVSHYSECTWKIHLYDINDKSSSNRTNLKNFDVVTFKSSKYDSYLGVDMEYNLVVMKQVILNQQIPVECLWELQFLERAPNDLPIIQVQPPKTLTAIRQSFLLLNQNQTQNNFLLPQNTQKVASEQIYSCNNNKNIKKYLQLRHLMSGKVLGSSKNQSEVKDNYVFAQLQDETSIMGLELSNRYDREFVENGFVNLVCNDDLLTTISQQDRVEHNQESDRKSSLQMSGSDAFFKKLSKQEDLQRCGFKNRTFGEAFIIQKVKQEYLKEILQPFSASEHILYYLHVLKNHPQSFYQLVKQGQICKIEFLLKGLYEYIIDTNQDNITDENTLPLYARQIILKELHFCEILVELLYSLCYKPGTKKLQIWKKQSDKLEQIFQLAYQLLTKLIQYNIVTKLYVSQWLEMFLHQYMVLTKPVIQQFLAEILDNNKEAIQNFLNDATILKIIYQISCQAPHEKYLKILKAICVSNNQPLKQNQTIVLKEFFQKIPPSYQFSFFLKKQKIQITLAEQSNSFSCKEIEAFYNFSLQNDDLQYWNYFISYFDLLSDIAVNRHDEAKKYIEKQYPLEILCQILYEAQKNEMFYLMKPFLKIIRYAFIDARPFEKIKKLRVIEFKDLTQNYTDYLIKIPSNSPIQELMKFLLKYLELQDQYYENIGYSKNLHQVLQMLKCTIEIGFWVDLNYIQLILKEMYRICSSIQDFRGKNCEVSPQIFDGREIYMQRKHKSTRINETNNVYMLCKQLACEIINSIFDLENNIKVFMCAKYFKDQLLCLELLDSKSKKDSKMKSSFFEETQKKLNTSQNKNINGFLDQQELQSEKENMFYNTTNWINQFSLIIQERKLSQHKFFELIFAELSFYENPLLPKFSLEILQRAYGQRKELIQNFEKLIIIVSGKSKELKTLGEIFNEKFEAVKENDFFTKYVENGSNIKTSLIWYHSNDNRKAGFIQNLFQLSTFLKKDFDKGRSQNSFEFDHYYPENGSSIVFCERESNYKLHQSISAAQIIHLQLIYFIVNFKTDLPTIYWKLLHSAYDFLTLLIWNHSENQKLIISENQQPYIILQHLKYNVGAIDFLQTLYYNNKELLFSEKELQLAISQTIPICNGYQFNNYYKSKLLDFLNVLLLIHDNVITFNQTLVFQKLQEKNKNVILTLKLFNENDSPSSPITQSFSDLSGEIESQFEQELLINQELFKDLIGNYQNSYEKVSQGFHEVDISPELTYIYTFFALFSQLIDEKHAINTKKCLKIHKFNDLIYMLHLSQDCWPLKRHLRSYINRLYYNNNIEDGNNLFLKTDLFTIIDDLQKIIDYAILPKHSYMQMAIIKNPIRFKYLASYLYMYLQEILITLNAVFLNESFLELLEETLNSNYKESLYILHFQFLDLCQKLSILEKIYKEQNVGNLCQSLINLFYSFINGFDVMILYLWEGLHLSANERMKFPRSVSGYSTSQKESLKIQYQIAKLERQFYKELKTKLSDTQVKLYLTSKVFTVDYQFIYQNNELNIAQFQKNSKKQQKDQKQSINDLINYKLRKIMNNWRVPQFQQFLDEEFYEICHKLSMIGQQSFEAYKMKFEVIALQDYIFNIIQICANTSEKQFSDEIIIFFLKMLNSLITEKNMNNKSKLVEVDTWTSDFWINYKLDITKEQDLLVQCGSQNLILSLLSENLLERNLNLLNECLLFGIALLLGGNTVAQNAILNNLKKDQQNTIIFNIKTIINKLTKIIVNNFSITNQEEPTTEDMIQTVDNYDFYDLDQKVMCTREQYLKSNECNDADFQKLYLTIVCRFFRFLQLLCENNNSEMKTFFRIQVNEQNNQMINSINLIEFTCVQLRVYLKILSRAFIIIPTQLIDFINEIVQLPCTENQITLCRTTFFEDVSNMAKYFQNKNNQEFRLFLSFEDQQELQELQNKILQTVLLVLEGNDEKIFKDLQNKLEVSFLLNFLTCNLRTLEIYTLEDLELYLNLQGKIFDDDLQRILNVCIIEQKMKSFDQNRWVTQFHERLDANPNLQNIYNKLTNLIQNIEIVYQGKSMTVFFPFHPLFNFLSEQTKQELLFSVNRDTQREKLLEMLNSTTILFYELDHNYKLNHYRIPINQQNLNSLDKLSSVLTIVINFIMVQCFAYLQILCYTVVPKGNTYFLSSHLYASLALKTFCITLLLVQVTFFVMESFQRIPIFLKKINKENNRFGMILGAIQEERCFLLLILLILSFLGTFVNSTFYVIHLVEIFSRVTILKNVFQAVSYNAKQLLVVAFLGVLFMFAFSVLSFGVYFDDIYPEEQQETCDSLISCMITLITSGVIGISMIQWDPVKFFFDMLFTVFFGLLFTNIVQGIMIDTFAELRDHRQKIDDDIKNKCYICAAQRSDLESKNKNFEDHIQKKHLIWNYIFYVKCLWLKEWTEYTGLEYWIKEKINQEDISWFPEAVKDGKNISERLDQLDNLMSQVLIQQENFQDE